MLLQFYFFCLTVNLFRDVILLFIVYYLWITQLLNAVKKKVTKKSCDDGFYKKY